jgi:DNA-directed RNA polymerase subunit M/transcription elongation factor TFIIS
MSTTFITNPEQFRANVRGKLLLLLRGTSSDNPNLVNIEVNIEISIYNYAIKEATTKKIVRKWENSQFAQIYVDRLRSVYMNMKDPAFIQMITSEDISAIQVGFITHQEMCPERWRDLIDRKTKRDQSRFTQNIEASTDMFKCKKCKSKRCTYYELQTRSADEPATIFITCLDCGKQFKN